jgi:hypothetical protein
VSTKTFVEIERRRKFLEESVASERKAIPAPDPLLTKTWQERPLPRRVLCHPFQVFKPLEIQEFPSCVTW